MECGLCGKEIIGKVHLIEFAGYHEDYYWVCSECEKKHQELCEKISSIWADLWNDAAESGDIVIHIEVDHNPNNPKRDWIR